MNVFSSQRLKWQNEAESIEPPASSRRLTVTCSCCLDIITKQSLWRLNLWLPTVFLILPPLTARRTQTRHPAADWLSRKTWSCSWRKERKKGWGRRNKQTQRLLQCLQRFPKVKYQTDTAHRNWRPAADSKTTTEPEGFIWSVNVWTRWADHEN